MAVSKRTPKSTKSKSGAHGEDKESPVELARIDRFGREPGYHSH